MQLSQAAASGSGRPRQGLAGLRLLVWLGSGWLGWAYLWLAGPARLRLRLLGPGPRSSQASLQKKKDKKLKNRGFCIFSHFI